MNTFMFTHDKPFLIDPILRDLSIKFVREKVEGVHTYLVDIQPMSPHL